MCAFVRFELKSYKSVVVTSVRRINHKQKTAIMATIHRARLSAPVRVGGKLRPGLSWNSISQSIERWTITTLAKCINLRNEYRSCPNRPNPIHSSIALKAQHEFSTKAAFDRTKASRTISFSSTKFQYRPPTTPTTETRLLNWPEVFFPLFFNKFPSAPNCYWLSTLQIESSPNDDNFWMASSLGRKKWDSSLNRLCRAASERRVKFSLLTTSKLMSSCTVTSSPGLKRLRLIS